MPSHSAPRPGTSRPAVLPVLRRLQVLLPATARRPQRPRRRLYPVALVLGGVVSVQIGAALAKGLVTQLGVAGSVFLRAAGAAAVLLLLTSGSLHRPSGLLRFRSLPDVAVLGVFGLVLAGMNLAFYAALGRIPLAAAVTIEFLGPLGVAVASSRRALDLLWAALAGVGVALLTGVLGAAVSGLDPVGVGLALLAGACWAGYILLGARLGAAFPGVTGVAGALAVTAVAVAPAGIATAGSALLRPDLLIVGVAVGVLSSAVPYSLEVAALRLLPAHAFGVLLSLEPAVAALAGFLLLDERLQPRQALAIALVSLASAGAARSAPTTT